MDYHYSCQKDDVHCRAGQWHWLQNAQTRFWTAAYAGTPAPAWRHIADKWGKWISDRGKTTASMGGYDMIRVVLADDQELIRESLSFVLNAQTDIQMVGIAKNGREAIELVRKEKPDVILMDIRMPEVDGVECTRLIKEAYPQMKVIILTTFDDDEYVFGALRYGASGYLLKGVSVAELANAVREAARGGSIIMPGVATKALQMFARMAKGSMQIPVTDKQTAELQENEWRIIREVGCGLSNKEIAAELKFSEGTVRNYLSNILSKLDLRDRTQLAIWAVQTGAVNRLW